MKDRLYIVWHLGLGDALIYNALVRAKAAEHIEVVIPVKKHNVDSVWFMYRDLQNVRVSPIDDDSEMLAHSREFCGEVLKLGMFGQNFYFKEWDKVMYRQAGVPFEDRWDKFKVERDAQKEVRLNGPFVLVDDDPARGFRIPASRLPERGYRTLWSPWRTKTIFDWCWALENAEEIHCIDSSFAILADSIPTNGGLVLHLYARPGAKPPIYRKQWDILRA